MKPYKVITEEICNRQKGLVTGTVKRFIGPADCIFEYFIRSLCYRHDEDIEQFQGQLEFFIYDKNQVAIDMFKYMLTWDGRFNKHDKIPEDTEDYEFLDKVIHDSKERYKVKGAGFKRNSTIGNIVRHGVNDFKKAWDIFKNSKFTFVHMDVIENKDKFLELVNDPNPFKDNQRQFVRLDISIDDNESIEYILKELWLRENCTENRTIVKLNSREDYLNNVYTNMKPYKFITEEVVSKQKGMVNSSFKRFIGPADNIFGYLIRSLGYRQLENLEDHRGNLEFIICDKNPLHIEAFRYMLDWDGRFNNKGTLPGNEDDPGVGESIEYELFDDFLHKCKNQFKIKGAPFKRNSTIGTIARHAFNDFHQAWDIFKHSKFTFKLIDTVKNNEEYVDLLNKLPMIKNKKSQLVRLDFSKDGYLEQDYKEAINNILHALWIKNIKEYISIIELPNKEDYAGKLYTELNPTFCILPWMHVQYKPTGQIKLCCRYDNINENKQFDRLLDGDPSVADDFLALKPIHDNLSIQKSSMRDSFFSRYWEKAREYTVENKPIVGCHKCYKEEQGGKGEVQISMRLGSSILYNNGYLHKKPDYEREKIEFLEVGFGNYCNLACLSCNSTLSTTWHDDETVFNDSVKVPSMRRSVFKKLDNIRFELDDQTISELKLIKFTGGEPMINPEFIRFIEQLCERGDPSNINLEIYTNCSYIPSPKLLTNLTRFKNVQLNLSIDAYGQANNYIRYGSKWQDQGKQNVSDAIDHYLNLGKENANIKIIMSSTLSMLSILEIPKLMDWWMDKFKESGNEIVVMRTSLLPTEYDGFYKIQLAYDPAYINVQNLPKEYYADVLTWIETYRNNFSQRYPDLGGIPECIGASLLKLEQTINKAKGDKEEAKNFLHYLETMDSVRGNSCENSIPDIVGRVKKYLENAS